MQSQPSIDLDKITYKFQMVKVKTDEGYANYIAKIIGPNGISFHIQDRYSSMRKFSQLLKNDISDKNINLNDLPPFPKKKLVGSMEPQFIDQRSVELGRYFNALLSKNQVARNILVLTYFTTHQADQESEQKILQLSHLVMEALQAEKVKQGKGGRGGGQVAGGQGGVGVTADGQGSGGGAGYGEAGAGGMQGGGPGIMRNGDNNGNYHNENGAGGNPGGIQIYGNVGDPANNPLAAQQAQRSKQKLCIIFEMDL